MRLASHLSWVHAYRHLLMLLSSEHGQLLRHYVAANSRSRDGGSEEFAGFWHCHSAATSCAGGDLRRCHTISPLANSCVVAMLRCP